MLKKKKKNDRSITLLKNIVDDMNILIWKN